MPESQLVKNSEQKSQDYLTEKSRDGKSFLKNQRTPASLAFKRQSSMRSPCGILWKGVLKPLTHVCTDLKISKETFLFVCIFWYFNLKSYGSTAFAVSFKNYFNYYQHC